MSTGWRARALGLVLVLTLVLLMAAFVPLMSSAEVKDNTGRLHLSYFRWTFSLSRPSLFLIVSFVGGALGGTLHGVASLTSHVAHGDLGRSWTLWYLANPFVGAAMAATFLFILQAGLGGQAADTSPTGLYGIAAFATLSGLFSRHALDKLKDIFDVAFASRPATAEATETGGLPTIQRLSPSPLLADGKDAQLTLVGNGYTRGSEVQLDGTRLKPVTLTSSSAVVIVPGELLEQPTTWHVRVRSGEGLWSNEADLEVRP
jgi:hypothetical protein